MKKKIILKISKYYLYIKNIYIKGIILYNFTLYKKKLINIF